MHPQVNSMKQATLSLQGLMRGSIQPQLHNKLTPIMNYLKSAQDILENISNGWAYEIQAEKLGELADIVNFNKYVAADVKTYCSKYIGKYKLNHNAKFWQKAKDVIQSAMEKAKREEQSNTQLKKMEKQLADKTKAEAELNKKIEGLQAQVKPNQSLNKQQEEALTKILQSTIRGEVRLFKQLHASQKYSYLKGNSYEQVEFLLKKYNLNEQILKPFLAQSLKFQQLQQKMEKLLNNNSVQDKTISVGDRCRNHWQKIEQLYLYYKKNELNKEKVEIIQQAIKSTCRGIPYEAKNNQRYEHILAHEKIARMIAPVIQNHQSQKKLYDLLKSIIEFDIGFVQNANKPTIERCIQIVNQLQKTINQKGQKLNKSIGGQETLKVNTIQQFFARIQIWKQLQQKKQQGSPTTTTIPFNNHQRSSPSRHHPQIPTNNTTTNPNKSMNNMWPSNRSSEQNIELAQIEQVKQDSLRESIRDQLQKAYELQQLNTRNLLLNDIENAGKLSWVQFTQRFDIKDKQHGMVQNININNLNNKSFAEVVIRKVLVSTQKSLQLLSNTVCEALSMNRNQLVIIQNCLKQEQQQNKKLTKELNELKQKISSNSSNQVTIHNSGSSYNIHNQQQETIINNEYYRKLETTVRQMQATMQKLQISRNNYAQQYEKQKDQRNAEKQRYNGLQTKLAAAQSISQKTLTAIKAIEEQKVKWQQLEVKYKQNIEQKQAQIEKFSSVNVNVAGYNKKTEEQNKTLHTQVSQLKQQLLQLQTKHILLKDEVYSCIRKTEVLIVDSKNINSVTEMYERMEKTMRYQHNRKQHYKQLYNQQQQHNAEYTQSLCNIQGLVDDNTIKTMSDIQNKIKQIVKANNLLKEQKQTQLKFKQKVLEMIQGPSQKVESQELETLILEALTQINKWANLTKIQHQNVVLANKLEEELFIVEQLQKYLANKITGFQFLYSSSQGTDMTAALEKKPNTLLLMKTKNDKIIGCFSSRSYCGTRDSTKSKGLLISPFSKAAYPLKQNYSPVEPNPQYLIFGNGTIKLAKNNTTNVPMSIEFSGKSAFSFVVNRVMHTEYNVLGESLKQVGIECFEVYQLQIKNGVEVVQIKSNITSAIKKEPVQISNRPSLMTQPKKSEGQIGDKVEEPKQRNLSSTKGLERQYKDMKEKVQKHEKSIKALQTQNEKLLQIIKKCDPDNQVLKPKCTSPPKNKPQNHNRSQTVKTTPTPVASEIASTSTSNATSFVVDQDVKQNDDLKKKLGEKQEQLRQAIKRQQIAEQENKKLSELKANLAKLKQQMADLQTKHDDLQKEKVNLKEQLSKKSQQIEQMTSRNSQLSNQIARNQQKKIETQPAKNLIQQYPNNHKYQLQSQQKTQQTGQNQKKPEPIIHQDSSEQCQLAHQALSSQLNTVKKQQPIHQVYSEQSTEQKKMGIQNITLVQSSAKIVQDKKQVHLDIFHKVIQWSVRPDQKPNEVLQQNSKQNQIQASVIVSQIMNEIIRQVEINWAKNIEDLLTNGKQAYKKLKEKDCKLTVIIQEKQKQVRELDEKIQKKTLQDANMSLQISSKATVVAEIEKMKQDLEQLNKDKKQLIEEMQRQRKELQDKLNQEKSAISKDLQKEKQDLMKVRKESNQTIQKQRQELTKIKNQASKSKQQIQKTKNVMSAAITKRNQVDKQVMAKQKQLRQLVEKENKFKDQLKKAEEELEKKNREKQLIDDLIAQMEQTKKQEQTLKQKVQQERATLSMLEKSYYQIQRKVADANRELSSLSQIRREYADIKSKLDKANSDYKQRQRQLISIKQSLRQYGQNEQRQKAKTDEIVKKISNQAKEVEKKLQKIKEEYQNAENALIRIENDLVKRRKQGDKIGGFSNRYFVGQIIQIEDDRQYLVGLLNKMYPTKSILKTRLLFSHPLMKDLNPHICIDEIPCYLIIMKMQNKNKRGQNYLISMYSERPLSKTATINNGRGFIASVTNKKAFYLKTNTNYNPRVTEYNDYYIIFGNSELRFRLSSNILEPSIGHMYRSFDTDDHKTAQIFTGDTESTSNFLSYEIYQIVFKQA